MRLFSEFFYSVLRVLLPLAKGTWACHELKAHADSTQFCFYGTYTLMHTETDTHTYSAPSCFCHQSFPLSLSLCVLMSLLHVSLCSPMDVSISATLHYMSMCGSTLA